MKPAQLPTSTLIRPNAFTRRSLLLGGAALGGSFLLSGCIGGGSTPSTSGSGSASSGGGPLTLQSDLSDPKPKAALESVVKGYTKYPVTLNTVATEQFRAQLSTLPDLGQPAGRDHLAGRLGGPRLRQQGSAAGRL